MKKTNKDSGCLLHTSLRDLNEDECKEIFGGFAIHIGDHEITSTQLFVGAFVALCIGVSIVGRARYVRQSRMKANWLGLINHVKKELTNELNQHPYNVIKEVQTKGFTTVHFKEPKTWWERIVGKKPFNKSYKKEKLKKAGSTLFSEEEREELNKPPSEATWNVINKFEPKPIKGI